MKYNFTSGAELLEKCKELNMTIHELCVEREAELTGISKEEVRDKMRVSLNIMKEAVEKAVQEAENTTREQLSTAREQIEQEKNRARQDIAIERDRAMNSLRNEVVSLSVAMAGKVVAKDMNSETNTKLIEDAIRQLDSKTIGL